MAKKHIEPIRLEVYKCPVCNAELYCSLQEAINHVNIPKGISIPDGVAFKENGNYYYVESFGQNYIESSNHGRRQTCKQYHPEIKWLKFGRIDGPNDELRFINSKKIKQKLREGKIELFTISEAKKLARDYHKNSIYSSFFKIRTPTKKLLEKIINTP